MPEKKKPSDGTTEAAETGTASLAEAASEEAAQDVVTGSEKVSMTRAELESLRDKVRRKYH